MSKNGLQQKRISIKTRDLIEIGEAMTDEESSSYLDLETMEITRIIHGFGAEVENDELQQQIEEGLDTRYFSIPNFEPWRSYEDMEAFIQTVDNESLRHRLEASINGKGAYRRFKAILLEHEDYREQWFAFQAARQETRAREWLEGEGFEVSIEPDD